MLDSKDTYHILGELGAISLHDLTVLSNPPLLKLNDVAGEDMHAHKEQQTQPPYTIVLLFCL